MKKTAATATVFLAVVFGLGAAGAAEKSPPMAAGGKMLITGVGEFRTKPVSFVVARTPENAKIRYIGENLGVPAADRARMNEAKYTVIGNFQMYSLAEKAKEKDRKKIGDFAKHPVTLTIPYPEEPTADPPVLYFWVTPGAPEEKRWVSIKDPELDRVFKVRLLEQAYDSARRVLVLQVARWPVNDIILSWDN